MKTALMVLHELLLKHKEVAKYELIRQNGPKHMSSFEIVCKALGKTATGVARSKQKAKQHAARGLLYRLSRSGYLVPSPFHLPEPKPCSSEQEPDTRYYTTLLRKLIVKYKMPRIELELVGATGPGHARAFTVCCSVGGSKTVCTASSKKAARQGSMEKMYKYLREYCRYMEDFMEDEAMEQARDKQKSLFVETSPPYDQSELPDLNCVVANSYSRFKDLFDEPKRQEALSAIERAMGEGKGPVEQVEACLQVFGLRLKWSTVELEGHSIEEMAMHFISMVPLDNPVTDAGTTRDLVATRLKETMQYMLKNLPHNKPNTTSDD